MPRPGAPSRPPGRRGDSPTARPSPARPERDVARRRDPSSARPHRAAGPWYPSGRRTLTAVPVRRRCLDTAPPCPRSPSGRTRRTLQRLGGRHRTLGDIGAEFDPSCRRSPPRMRPGSPARRLGCAAAGPSIESDDPTATTGSPIPSASSTPRTILVGVRTPQEYGLVRSIGRHCATERGSGSDGLDTVLSP